MRVEKHDSALPISTRKYTGYNFYTERERNELCKIKEDKLKKKRLKVINIHKIHQLEIYY